MNFHKFSLAKERNLRRLFFGLLMLVLGFRLLAAQEDPMDSFMGIKWGTIMFQAQKEFQYADKIQIRSPYFDRWILKDMDFGKLKLTIIFDFNNNLCLSRVIVLDVSPNDFSYLVDFLTAEYGQPKNKTDEAACWWNETRTILFLKNMPGKTNIGLLNFSPR